VQQSTWHLASLCPLQLQCGRHLLLCLILAGYKQTSSHIAGTGCQRSQRRSGQFVPLEVRIGIKEGVLVLQKAKTSLRKLLGLREKGVLNKSKVLEQVNIVIPTCCARSVKQCFSCSSSAAHQSPSILVMALKL